MLVPASASAQAWIGYVAGDAAARSMQGMQDCAAGTGRAQIQWDLAAPKVEAAMAGYAEAMATGDIDAASKFVSRKRGGGWAGPDGVPQKAAASPDPFMARPTTMTRLGFAIVSGNASSRGVWKVSPAGTSDGREDVYYTIDFTNRWYGHWDIWRVRVTNGPDAPGVPDTICLMQQTSAPW